MKSLVGDGSSFLPTPTDHITLYKTHSLRWLAQIVCQIIKAAQWEAEFQCVGVSGLAEFSALIGELEAMDPVLCSVHSRERGRPGELPPSLRSEKILGLVPKLDALLDLLAATADGLAATSDLMEVGQSKVGTKPTVH
ncbi:MAG: hypothetical protein LC114_05870 [Bryobacterales bacterium]|nr:hypothetical protein [Bryobacterales bacterium]